MDPGDGDEEDGIERGNEYQNAKIYVIRNNQDELIYVGSTIKELLVRMNGHKNIHKTSNYKLYVHMRKWGFDSFRIELIENYPCNSKGELEAREGYFIEEMGATLNERGAGVTFRMFGGDFKEYALSYYQTHKEEILKRTREQVHCDICYCSVIRYAMHAHTLTLKHLNNLAKTEEQRAEERSKKVYCSVCDWYYVRQTIRCTRRHEASRKHKRNLEKQMQSDNAPTSDVISDLNTI